MTIDISTHRTILFQILKSIYTNPQIAPLLGFKGGTAALMYYNLDRFSVDLDFDLLDDEQEDFVFDQITAIISKYGTVKDSYKKHFNLFWSVSYEDKSQNIKVEINHRRFNSQYESKIYLGVPMQVMVKEDMFAHKLVAMYERIGKTSRDIYDVHFFLQNRFPINKALVEERTKMPFDTFISKCISKLEKLENRHILDGVGELLTPNQKDHTKATLKQDTLSLLHLLISK